MEMPAAEDFNNGRIAYVEGKTKDANPYPFTGAPHKFWNMGYDYAELDANKNTVNAEPLEHVAADPMSQGRTAFIDGLGVNACPYDPGDANGTPEERQSYQDYRNWHEGFYAARRDKSILRTASKPILTGGHNDYWRVKVSYPTREGVEPYTAEFEDIARALKLTPSEYNEAKAIWRTAGARLGNGKPGINALYDAQKRVHYAKLDLADYEREVKDNG